MKIELSEKCINELAQQLAPIVLREDFKENLRSHYLEGNSIHIDDEDFECFVDDVYEKFQEYHNYEASFDKALYQAIERLVYNGDYVIYDCAGCGDPVILRGDEENKYECKEDRRLCRSCYEGAFGKCQMCGCTVDKLENPIQVHGHYYCSTCAAELLTNLMQPDVTTNK